jgi:hypothetical protein
MSINYTQEEVNIFFEYIKQSDTNEFEIRFGKFNGKKFVSGIEINVFYRLKSFLTKLKTEIKYTNTFEEIYVDKSKNDHTNIKKIKNLDNNNFYWLQKKNISKMDILNYNLRFALSSEEIINNKDVQLNTLSLTFKRLKKRITFLFKDYQIDLTVIDDNIFECELEVLQNHSDPKEKYNSVMQMIITLSQVINDSFYILTNDEKQHVLHTYSTLLRKNYFIAAQPETLHKSELHLLYNKSNPYSVTEKLDGERNLCIIDKYHQIYFIDNNLDNIKKTDFLTNTYKTCILDGELLVSNGKFEYFIFDILVFDGADLRGHQKYDLTKRLELCNLIKSDINTDSNYFNIHVKEYIFKDVFLGSEIILNRESLYKNDGLIFTPINECYPLTKKWKNLLKWKPSDQNSIDFYSIKKDNNVWELYVQGKTDDNSTKKILFDVKKIKGCFDIDTICNSNTKIETFSTIFDDTLLDPITQESYKTNTVIEYIWDKQQCKFVPIRTRWDKTLNPSKHGNFSEVACDIWKNIHNSITKELLFKTTIYNNEDIYFKNMRFFHNRIKEVLYDTYTKNTNYLLELSSGKGGDLNKWVKNNIKHVNGYDISKKNIQECVNRYNTLLQKNKTLVKKINYAFYQQDLTDSKSPVIISSQLPTNTFYDNVFCNFAIHYFFQSQNNLNNIIDILDLTLNNKGYFVVTFMDSNQIMKLMDGKQTKYITNQNEVVYYLQMETFNKKSLFGNKIKIILSGNNILNEGSDEYIIDFNLFTEYMLENGYDLIDSKLFNDKSISNFSENLSDFEKDISYLNRYCVFQKNKKTFPLNIANNKFLNSTTKYIDPIIITNLQNNSDLSVYRVTSRNDILEILQSIFYKYDKNNIIDIPIVSFDDIKQIFYSINKNIENSDDLYPYFLNNDNHDKILDEDFEDDITKKFICFYYNSFKIENTDENDLEEHFQDNWYIVLDKRQILLDSKKIKDILLKLHLQPASESKSENTSESKSETSSENTSEKTSENTESKSENTSENTESKSETKSDTVSALNIKENQDLVSEKNAIKARIKQEMKDKNNKITVAEIKKYLKELNSCSNGLKAELIARLLKELQLS